MKLKGFQRKGDKMDRLTKWNEVGIPFFKQSYECEICGEPTWRLPDLGNGSPTDKLCEYEDLEEFGKLVKLPCKLGATVYEPGRGQISEYIVNGFRIEPFSTWIEWTITKGIVLNRISDVNVSEIGKTVFLTYEEAEAKLKEQIISNERH